MLIIDFQFYENEKRFFCIDYISNIILYQVNIYNEQRIVDFIVFDYQFRPHQYDHWLRTAIDWLIRFSNDDWIINKLAYF